MFLMGIILYREEYLEDILALFAELGILDVLTVEAQSLRRMLSHRNPLFAGLRFERADDYAKLLLAIVESKATPKVMKELLLEIGVNLDEPGVGRVFMIPLSEVQGFGAALL